MHTVNSILKNIYIEKLKIHPICEIKDFVEIHLRKLCVILRSRVLRVVCRRSATKCTDDTVYPAVPVLIHPII